MELMSFESLYVGKLILDGDLRVVEISDDSAQLLNCSPSDILSKKFCSDFGPKKAEFEECLNGRVQVCEFKTLNGDSFNACFRTKERSNKEGYEVVFIKETPHFSCQDGESVHYQQLLSHSVELEKQAEFFENIFSNISYDLKTPIGIVLGYCELLLKSKTQGTQVDTERALRTIYRNCAWIADVVEKLESLTILVKRGKSENKVLLDLGNYINETVSRLTKISFAKMTRIETKRIDEIKLFASSTLVSLLIDELFKNAIYYCKRGKEIEVNLLKSKETIKLSVEISSLEDELPPLNHILDFKNDNFSAKVECLGLGAVKYLANLNDFSFNIKKKGSEGEIIILEKKFN